jgi:hypothetical protein
MHNTNLPLINILKCSGQTAVGKLEQSSAIDAARNWVIMLAISQPQTIPPVPVYLTSVNS